MFQTSSDRFCLIPAMNTPELNPLCPEAVERLRERLPERVIEVMAHAVGILVDVYDRNRSQHEPDSGDDAMALGVRNWRNWWNLMDERLSELDGVEVSWPRGSFQAVVSDFVLHFWSGQDTTAVRFDNGRTKPQVVSENIAQMTLWTEEHRSELPHIVLIHEGDAAGLRVVAAGAPEDLGIVGEPWHWREIIYRGEVNETGEFIRPNVEVPSYEEQPWPTPLLSLRETKTSQQPEGPE
jgi:hypothetical protein